MGDYVPEMDATQAGVATDSGLVRTLFFGPSGRRRFALLHEPAKPRASAPVLVVCQPHFEERLWAHRVILDLAKRACAEGFPVFRFDFSGHGDSDGEFEEFGFRDLEDDVACAVDEAVRLTGATPVLAGLRLGATLAGRYASVHGVPVALWAPIVDLDAWLRESLRTNLTFQVRRFGRVQQTRAQLIDGFAEGREVLIEGYGLTSRFWSEALASGGLSGPAFPGRAPAALVVRIQRVGTPPQEFPGAGEPVVRIVDVADEPFWSDTRRHRNAAPEATAATVSWLSTLEPPCP